MLLSLAAGFFTYLAGAVIWSTVDPQGAGSSLLFTLPPAVAGVAAPALLAMLSVVIRRDGGAASPL
jgi:hypothetical protein